MRIEREGWTPMTIVIETREEAEILHKILGSVIDDTVDHDAPTQLFYRLGEGISAEGEYRVSGKVRLTDN